MPPRGPLYRRFRDWRTGAAEFRIRRPPDAVTVEKLDSPPAAPRRAVRAGTIAHALLVLAVPVGLVGWLFARFLLNDLYLVDSDLYELFLPVFLAPIRLWSSFEYSGLPVFADPGDYALYPPNLLFGRLFESWTLLIASAYVIAAWATYAYVFALTRSAPAAALAAVAYALSEALMEGVAHLGILHAIAWVPLMALAVDQVRGPRAHTWMAIGGFALACSLLAGHAQPTLYALYCLGAYALTGLLIERSDRRTYLRTAGMFALGVCIAAVKVLPSLEASTLTARQDMSFERFVSRALTIPQSLSALFPTLQHGDARETPTYVGIATLLFAIVAVVQWGAQRRRREPRHWRIAFWTGVSVFALLMGLGDNTPVASLAYHLPLYDKFRVASRHLYLFAFALAVLAGYGMAAIQRREVSVGRLAGSALMLFLALGGAAALFLVRPALFTFDAAFSEPGPGPLAFLSVGLLTQFVLALVASVLAAWMLRGRLVPVAAAALLVVAVADMVRALPYDVRVDGIEMTAMEAENIAPSVHAVALGQDLAGQHQRALAIGGAQSEAVLPAAFARYWQVPIAGGYGPMLIDRYSRLAMMGSNGEVNPFVLANENSALDLLAVRYLLVYPEDLPEEPVVARDGDLWEGPELSLPVGRPDCGSQHDQVASIGLPPGLTVSGIAIVTHLECSENVAQGTPVGAVRFVGTSGVHETELRAGIDTAEGDLADPDVRGRAKHQAPAPFDEGDDRLLFETRIALPAPAIGSRIELEARGTGGWLSIDRLTLLDVNGRAHPQSGPHVWLRNPQRWRTVRTFSTARVTDRRQDTNVGGERQITVIENLRAASRAWIVPRVLAANDADALSAVHYSLLPNGERFDYRRLALVDPEHQPPVQQWPAGTSTVRVTAIGDGDISLAVTTTTGGFLVLSENAYPGWRATIDDEDVPVYRTNVTLQGIVVPPGEHRVRFTLVSTSLRLGYIVSLAGVLACVLLTLRMPSWL